MTGPSKMPPMTEWMDKDFFMYTEHGLRVHVVEVYDSHIEGVGWKVGFCWKSPHTHEVQYARCTAEEFVRDFIPAGD